MFIDINSNSINFHGDRICGDTFVSQYIPNQRRTVAVLSDGMGHGVKAGILSRLTASIVVKMGSFNESITKITKTILATLPICQVRGLSYSTFTIVDIDHNTGIVSIIEYDNPQVIVVKHNEKLILNRERTIIDNTLNPNAKSSQIVFLSKFVSQEGDRIVTCSDGVTQSGLGRDEYPFGWGDRNLSKFVIDTINEIPTISSRELSLKVLNSAYDKDLLRAKDDISCAVFYFRESKRLLLCSCPPSTRPGFDKLVDNIKNESSKTIVCGYPLAEQIAAKLNSTIRKNFSSTDPNLPPLWFINGVDLVTEGFITLTRVLDIFENYENCPQGRGPAYKIVKMLMEADHIQMVIGLNESTSFDTQFIDNFPLRRKQLERIGALLETKFAKAVTKTYL